jgi:hypothetical protein
MNDAFVQGHALLIGVGVDLPNTVDDAVGMANILMDRERCAYPGEQVHVLTSGEATRQDVLAGLDALAQSTTPESTALVYFSGHGYQVTTTTGPAYYLMPYGYDVNQLYKTAISGAEFTAKLRAIPAQKLLVLLDCCHAGGVGEAKAAGLEMVKAPLPPEALELFAEGSGRVLIASSTEKELSYAGKPYSAFTLALIEALCGAGVAKQDGYVRVADLALHTREMVPGRTGNKQHPVLHFEQADNFVVAFYAGGDTKPKGLPFKEEPQIEPEPGAWRVMFDQRGQTVHGSRSSILGDVHGPVLSGQFGGPVTVGGGEAVDLRGSQGVIYQPSGSVEQQFGNRISITGDGNVIGDHSRSTVVKRTTQGASLEEFSRLIAELKSELAQGGLDEDTAAAVEADVRTVEEQAAKPQPRGAIIVSKLKSITEMLTAVAGTAAAAGKLLPLAQKAAEWAGQLFR